MATDVLQGDALDLQEQLADDIDQQGRFDGVEAGSDDEGEGRLGGRNSRVAALLTKLATTARSFLLYDARNDAIRSFLSSLLQGFSELLAEEHVLRLEIQPFEITFAGEPVYLNRDRERSLAFRLYRDGVRVLTFSEGFSGEELARLLEILSTRYTGVHQHEDDTVTLLWKAGFEFLDVVAVEGFTPETGQAEAPRRRRSSEPSPFLPEDADFPLPTLSPPSTPAWVDVDDDPRRLLCDQVAAAGLPEEGLRLLSLLVAGLKEPAEQMAFSEAAHLFEEIRDFLISADNLASLLEYIHLLRRLAQSTPVAWDPGRQEGVVRLLVSCGSDRVVRRLIHSVESPEPGETLPRLIELLDLVCPDPFTSAAEALATEEGPAGRAVARQLVEHYGKRPGHYLRQRFAQASGRVAADLLRSLARMDGEAPAAFLARQCAHADVEVREEALWHLERIAYTGSLGHAILDAFRRTAGDQRRRLLLVIERSRDRRFVEPLVGLLDGGLEGPAEAFEVGRVLGRLEGPACLERFRDWLRPTGHLLLRRLPGSLVRQLGAVSAVAQVPGPTATELLERAAGAASPELREWLEPLLAGRPSLEERATA